MTGIDLLRLLGFLAALAAAPGLLAAPAPTAERTPLLQDGKTTLYRRVLTRPGAELVDQPGAGPGRPVDTFSRFYVDAADAGMLQPDAFFDSLRSIAAQYGRDPNLATSPQAVKLADLGLLGEYLEGLPYKSDAMALDQDTWSRWGTQRQFDFVSQLKGKLRLYERYNADTARWVSLAPDSPPGERVYPVPLRDLP